MVGGEVHGCSLCPHSSGSPPSPGEDHWGSLAGFHLLQAKPACSSIFSTPQFLCILVMGGGVTVKPCWSGFLPCQGWPSSLQTEPCAGLDFVMQGHDSERIHETASTSDSPIPVF